jgi:hypothetical protein
MNIGRREVIRDAAVISVALVAGASGAKLSPKTTTKEPFYAIQYRNRAAGGEWTSSPKIYDSQRKAEIGYAMVTQMFELHCDVRLVEVEITKIVKETP